MTTITSPVKGHTGKTSFGPLEVEFVDGKAEVDDLPQGIREYLLRAGYKVGRKSVDQPDPTEPADPRKIGDGQVGTALRDAAVDPRKGDFLAPTNAGKANPHGPDVVAPGIHAEQGVRPVKGGEVHVDKPAAQDKAETAHTATSTDGTPVTPVELPEGDLDSRVEWVRSAETQDERAQRASAVFAHEQEADPDADLTELSGRLTGAVYQSTPSGPEAPAGNASRDDWAAYVTALGEDPGDRGRDELRDTYGPKA